MGVVPQADHWLAEVVLVSQDAEGGGAQHKVAPPNRVEAEPAGSEHAQEMRTRKQQNVAVDGAHAADDALGRRLAARAAVAEQPPIGVLLEYLRGAPALVVAVVPFHQIRIEFRPVAKTRQLAGPDGALQPLGK